MRLAQIARKVQVKPSEIRSFVKKTFDMELDVDPNIKLADEQVAAILEEFKVEEVEPVVEVVEEKVVEEVVEDEIDSSIDTDIDALKEVAEIAEEAPKAKAVKAKKKEVKKEIIEEEEPVAEEPDAEEPVAEEPEAEEKKVVAKKESAKTVKPAKGKKAV